MEYPTSFFHLLKILFKTDEKKLFALSNPDGYFYLYYIKVCIKFFLVNFVISGLTIAYLCYKSNTKEVLNANGEPIPNDMAFLERISLAYTLSDEEVYSISLILTTVTSLIAYYFLFDFCKEMTKFEFQPDQKIMDQFI